MSTPFDPPNDLHAALEQYRRASGDNQGSADGAALSLAMAVGRLELDGSLTGLDASLEVVDSALGADFEAWHVAAARAWSTQASEYLSELRSRLHGKGEGEEGAGLQGEPRTADQWIGIRESIEAGARGLGALAEAGADASREDLHEQVRESDEGLERLLESWE